MEDIKKEIAAENPWADSLALKSLLPVFSVTFFLSFLLFEQTYSPLKNLLTFNFAIILILSFCFYFYGFLKSTNVGNEGGLFGGEFKILLFSFFLSVIYAGMIAVMTLFLGYLISHAYPGAQVVRLAIALSGASSAVFAMYFALKSSSQTEIDSIIRNLTLFFFGGLLLSALSASDPEWYVVSFSYLGMTPSLAAEIFNITMIFTGLGTLVLSNYFFKEFDEKSPDLKEFKTREKYSKWLLWTMGVGIFLVGLIPWEPGIRGQIHTLAATLAGFFFFLFAVFSKKLLPGLQKIFYNTSYLMGTLVVGTYVTYLLGKSSLATVEIIVFITVFIWIFLAIRCLEIADSTNH